MLDGLHQPLAALSTLQGGGAGVGAPRGIDREVVLSMIQQIRLQELERFRREQEARRNRGRIVPRMPSTRVGRFLNRRVNAMDQWLDTLLDG